MRGHGGSASRAKVGVVMAAVAAAIAGCGGDGDRAVSRAPTPAARSGTEPLAVVVATSLKPAVARFARSYEGAAVRASYAGETAIAGVVERKPRPDVVVGDDLVVPRRLRRARLVSPPVVFARDPLVLVVPSGYSLVAALIDLAQPDIDVAIAVADSPLGAGTRALFAALPPARERRMLANAGTPRRDAASILRDVASNTVDAGIVYAGDVPGAGDAVRAIALPTGARFGAPLAAAVVAGTSHRAAAKAFIEALRAPSGARALARLDLEPEPRPR